jgi:hypothetical protein
VSTNPGQGGETQIAGQQSLPTTAVPPPPAGLLYSPARNQTNNLAVVSLVSGVLSFFAHVVPVLGGFGVAIVAIITGYMARKQIKESGEQGMWMATTGIVIGFIHIALLLFVVLLLLFVVFVLGIALFGAHPSRG